MKLNALPAESATISMAIIAWNEQEAIGTTIASLASQTFFAELAARGLTCEILCLCNGCTDQTAHVARKAFQHHFGEHPHKQGVQTRVLELVERGKINTWNRYVHSLSPRQAEVLFLVDADIVLNEPTTLWNMYRSLGENPQASVAVDRPIKDVAAKSERSLRDRFSASASRTTQTAVAQLSGQLYCIRAHIARNIHLPRDLSACEDGFIKALVCTDFLTQPVQSERIVLAPEASHVFAAYTSLNDILRNQKRQMIGQTIVHILVDRFLNHLPLDERTHLADTILRLEQNDPLWLKRLIADYLRETRYFWRLVPGAITIRFRRLAHVHGLERLRCLPAATAGFLLSLAASWLAYRFLKLGHTNYWPDTRSPQLHQFAHNNVTGVKMAPQE